MYFNAELSRYRLHVHLNLQQLLSINNNPLCKPIKVFALRADLLFLILYVFHLLTPAYGVISV